MEHAPNLEASVAIHLKISLTNEFRMVITLLGEEIVEYAPNLEASVAMCSESSTKEFGMAIALLEIPVSGCAGFNTF